MTAAVQDLFDRPLEAIFVELQTFFPGHWATVAQASAREPAKKERASINALTMCNPIIILTSYVSQKIFGCSGACFDKSVPRKSLGIRLHCNSTCTVWVDVFGPGHAWLLCLTTSACLTCLWSTFQEMLSQHGVVELPIMAAYASFSLLTQHLASTVRSTIVAWSRMRNESLLNHAVQPQKKRIESNMNSEFLMYLYVW